MHFAEYSGNAEPLKFHAARDARLEDELVLLNMGELHKSSLRDSGAQKSKHADNKSQEALPLILEPAPELVGKVKEEVFVHTDETLERDCESVI